MAGLTLTVVEGGKGDRYELEEIDPVYAETFQEALRDAPGKRLEAKFATKDEADDFLKQGRDYGYQVEPRLSVTGNSLKSGAARFRVSLWVKPEKDDKSASE